MTKKIIHILLLMFIPYLFLTANRITVLEENEDELLIEFRLPQYSLQDEIHDGVEYQRIICEGSVFLGKEGFPAIPYFAEAVGIPPDGSITLQLLDSEKKIYHDVNIIPVPYAIPKEDYLDYNLKENEQAYATRAHYPENSLAKGDIAYAGDRCLSSFRIFPFRYSAATKTLEVAQTMRFRVFIHGEKSRSRTWMTSSNYIDTVADDLFLNNRTSKYWRYEPEKKTHHIPRSNGEIEEIQFIIDEEGIYKVTKEHLIEMLELFAEEFFGEDEDRAAEELNLAWDWEQINPRYLELHSKDGVVPLHFTGEENGSFDDGDYFEFYADKNYGVNSYYDEYTSENVYTLKLVDHLGARMAVKNGGLQFDDSSMFQTPAFYEQTVHFEEQNMHESLGVQWSYHGINFYREDRYFWDRINAPDLKAYPFHLEFPAQTEFKAFTANVALFGLTYTNYTGTNIPNPHVLDHNAIVRVNTAFVNQHQWNGQREKIFSTEMYTHNDRLQHGSNNLYVSLPGSYIGDNLIATERVLLDYFNISYWREYKTSKDYIKFTRPSDRPNGLYQFTVENFSNPEISVYKLGTAVFEHMQIELDADNLTYTLTMQDEVNSLNENYVAVTEEQKKVPKYIRPRFPSRLKDTTNAADYVIITIEEFVRDEGAIKLKEVWQEQGKQVELVSTQDIYDEFNHGVRSAHAIKDFISYAYHYWSQPQLTHVLLLGDGITDERDNSPNRHLNLIPIRFIWAQQRGSIASDNWYARIVGDDLIPDVSVSRIGVWEKSQLMDIAEKTEHYLNNPNFDQQWHGRAVMAAGGNPGEGSLFARQSERLKKRFLRNDYHLTRVYANTSGLPSNFSGTTSTLMQAINQGALFVSFMGHGGGYVWADYNLLNRDNIKSFNNDNYPLFISMSCFASAFNGLRSSSIGEELIIQPRKGGIAHIGFTGYGYVNADTLVFSYILDGIYDKKLGNIGQIADYTQTRFFIDMGYGNTGVALTGGFSLLGDGMIDLLVPENNQPISLSQYHLAVGDTLTMTADFPPDIESAKFIIYDENDVQLPVNQYFPFSRPVVNGTLSVSDFVVPTGSAIRKNYIKVFANGDERELIGTTSFTVGKSAVANLELQPAFPTEHDSVYIQADFFDRQGVEQVFCEIFNFGTRWLEMSRIDERNITYRLAMPIEPQSPGEVIIYRFHIFNSAGDVSVSDSKNFMINGPDMIIENHEFSTHEMQPAFKVSVQNIGTMTSPPCQLKLYYIRQGEQLNQNILLNEVVVPPLEVNEQQYIYLPIQNFRGRTRFRIIINENEESFSEIGGYSASDQYQNKRTGEYDINVFPAGADAILAESLDGHLTADFPEGMLPVNHLFSINRVEDKVPLNQPDLEKVHFFENTYSPVYEVRSFNEGIYVDSLQTLPDEEKVLLSFYYGDSKEKQKNSDVNYSVYRWFEPFQKWIIMGGALDPLNSRVILESNKLGKFALFNNHDRTPPTVQVNVEGQEFSQENYAFNPAGDDDAFAGGYVSRNGVLSIVLSDANGIDAFTKDIVVKINNIPIPPEEYTVSLSLGNLTSVPIKYKLENLSYGDHHLKVECTDVNGNHVETDPIRLRVYKDFSIQNFANYPNPVRTRTEFSENEGRTRFTYVLTEDADDVKIKIYTVSGRLVKTFRNLPSSVGYHEYPRTVYGWDCRDDDGFFLANGVYFYKIIARKGSKTIEKLQKMAILK